MIGALHLCVYLAPWKICHQLWSYMERMMGLDGFGCVWMGLDGLSRGLDGFRWIWMDGLWSNFSVSSNSELQDELLSGQIEKFCCSARRCSAVLKHHRFLRVIQFVQRVPTGSRWEAQGADIKALSVKGACRMPLFGLLGLYSSLSFFWTC